MHLSLRWTIAQWFELRWWKNYLKNKDNSDYINYKTNYWIDLLEQVSEIDVNETNKDILEIGCGPSGIFMVFKNSKIDAIDPLIEKYEKELKVFSKKLYPNVNFYALPFEEFSNSKQYDIIFCMNTINHVSNIETTLNKIVNMLKPEGYIVETIDAHNHKFLKYLFRTLSIDILHPHQYDLKEYIDMLVNKNCKIIDVIRIKKHFIFSHYMIVAKPKVDF